jgi:hypothetical protein
MTIYTWESFTPSYSSPRRGLAVCGAHAFRSGEKHSVCGHVKRDVPGELATPDRRRCVKCCALIGVPIPKPEAAKAATQALPGACPVCGVVTGTCRTVSGQPCNDHSLRWGRALKTHEEVPVSERLWLSCRDLANESSVPIGLVLEWLIWQALRPELADPGPCPVSETSHRRLMAAITRGN